MPIPAHALLMAAGGGAAPFSPDDIAGLDAWWDAADQSSGSMQIGTGGEVERWYNLVGGGTYVDNGFNGHGPITGTRTINGVNALDFNGTNQALCANSSWWWQSGSDNTVFIVFQPDVVNVNQSIFNEGRSTNDNGEQKIWITSGGLVYFNAFNTSASFLGEVVGDSVSASTPYRVRFTDAGSGSTQKTLRVNNGTPDTATFSTAGQGGGRQGIGGRFRQTLDLFFNGLIGEILVYDTLLGSGDITSVETYLTAKWGV